MFRKIALVLGIVSAVCSAGAAIQKVSSNFSIGVGQCMTNTDVAAPVFGWSTIESTAVNTSQRQGEFTFSPTVSSLTGTTGGWLFPNRVPTYNGAMRAGSGYDNPTAYPNDPWQVVLNASYNGDKGTGGKIKVNITSMSVYVTDYGPTGVATAWFNETTAGHVATSPIVTLKPCPDYTYPSSWTKLVWNPGTFQVAGETVVRSFGIDEANTLYGCLLLDGFEITGNVVYEYNEPIIAEAPKDSNNFNYKWEADSVPDPVNGVITHWTANGDGTVTIANDYMQGEAGWKDLDMSKWTLETRLKVDAAKESGIGVYNIDIQDGNDAYCLVVDGDCLRDAFNPSGPFANVYYPISLNKFHAIRIAKYGNGNQKFYIDGIPITFKLTPIKWASVKVVGHGCGVGGIETGAVTIDYFRLDSTGAYAPITTATAKTGPIIPAANRFADSLGIVASSFFGPQDKYMLTGSKLWRRDFHWCEYEKTTAGIYDFSQDTTVPALELHGQTAILILSGQNPLYQGYDSSKSSYGVVPLNATQRQAFYNFAAATATHFKGRRIIFELGNEQDSAVSGADYASWAIGTAAAMRAADPNVIIAGAAAHVYATSWLTAAFNAGLLNAVDLVTVHLYTGMNAAAPQPAPEEVADTVTYVKTLVAGYKPNMPVACSEWGYNRYIDQSLFTAPTIGNHDYAVTAEQQRNYLPRCYMLNQLWGLRFNVWYNWNLPMTQATAGFGLLNGSDSNSPAYYAMTNMAAQLPDANFVQRVDVGDTGDYVLKFATRKGTRWAIWTKGTTHNVSFSVPSNRMMSAVDITGSQTNHIMPNANTISVQASGAVQYVYESKLLNLAEFADFAAFWQHSDCESKNDCAGYDHEPDGDVDFVDLANFCSKWLTPVD